MTSKGKKTVALIVGCNGFTGKHLVSLLRKKRKSFKIIGIDVHTKPASDVDIYIKDTRKKDYPALLYKELEYANKIYAFHIAGLIYEQNIDKLLTENLTITHKVFYSLIPYKGRTVVLNVGSSAEYGDQGRNKITEKCKAKPVSSYGFSKLFQTQLAKHYYDAYELPIVMTRTFNIVGPGQTDKLVCGSLVEQAYQCKIGSVDKIVTKGLNTYRDFIDVRDAVRAYVMLIEKGTPGEIYNVASGKATQIKKALIEILTISKVIPQVIEKTASSKSNIPYQKASIEKIKKKAGWKPVYSFEQSIKDMIEYR